VRPKRRSAPGANLGEKSTFGLDCLTCRGVIDGREQVSRLVIVVTTLDCNTTLPDHRDESFEVEILRDPIREAEYLQRCCSHHDRPTSGNLLQASGDVPTKVGESEIRSDCAELCLTSNRSRRHGRTMSEIVDGCANQYVPCITALAPCADDETRRVCRGKILRRVDRDVRKSFPHCVLNFLDEHSLPTDRVERHVATLVAESLDEDQFIVATRCSAKSVSDHLGLGSRLGARPSGDANHSMSNKSRNASEIRSPCGVPALFFNCIDGECNNFATIDFVNVSTASRSCFVKPP
jgi:hypothetical protein